MIAENLALKSITFPAIGTGNLGFPRSVVAKLLFDKVFEYSSKNGLSSLKEVHFLLHAKDTASIQVSCHVLLSLLCADVFGSVLWFNASQQGSTVQLLTHSLPLPVGWGGESGGKNKINTF